MATIDFIFFDLGNVILNFDHAIAFENAGNVGGVTAEDARRVLVEENLQIQYETGLIDDGQFHQQFCDRTGGQCDQADLLHAISDIFWVNRGIVPVLTQLRSRGFRLGILSNTCDAHWQFVFRRYRILREFFEPIVVSYEERSMKPDAVIYQNAIAKANAAAGVAPGKIFFTDDRQENVDGAIAAGMDAVLFTSVADLIQQLSIRGVQLNG